MRAPWSYPPVVSDATMLGLRRYCGGAVEAGEKIYELLLQNTISDGLNVLFTEVDSGGNVTVTPATATMDGNNAWASNGIFLTAGLGSRVMEVSCKMTQVNANVQATFGVNTAAALPNARNAAAGDFYQYNSTVNGRAGTSTEEKIYTTLVAGDVYNCRMRYDPDEAGDYRRLRIFLTSPTQFPVETLVFDFWTMAPLPATIYPYMQRLTANGAALTVFSEFRVYQDYSVAGPTLTQVADAGAGRVFTSLDFTNVVDVGGFGVTNLLFQYSWDNGVPAYNGVWLTLAQLNAVGVVPGVRRYLRVMEQVNSDGVTQQYSGDVNADDLLGISAPRAYGIIKGAIRRAVRS